MIIDISKHNGVVQFDKIKDVEEIFVRSSLGFGDFDDNLKKNANGAHNAGFPVGYYHFAYPHSDTDPVQDAAKQANYFVDTIQKLPTPAHLAVDLENFSKDKDCTLSKADYAIWLQSFLDTVEKRTGTKCLIYSYADYLNRHLPTDHKFGAYPLWIASYSKKKSPVLPNGWKQYFMWQYSESGKLAGLNGNVDLSKKA